MQLKMSENSLFAHLLRAPWWVSFLVALVIGLGGRALVSEDYYSYALAFTLPSPGVAPTTLGGVSSYHPPSGRPIRAHEATRRARSNTRTCDIILNIFI